MFFSVSIVFSFLCSLWEAVLLSISPSYMQVKLNEEGKVGSILKGFKENIDRPLAAILTVNTIAHTAGAIGVGQEATKIWADSSPIVTGLVVPAVMTAAILILSEIIPKTIGANNWRLLAPFTVRSLDIVIKITFPIIWACQLITRVFNSSKEKNVFSRTDFLAMIQIGSKEGSLDEAESKFIHNLLHFRNYKVKDVMTPRTVTVSAPQDMTARAFYDRQDELVFSRIPLKENHDQETIVGYILKDEVLEHLIDEHTDKELRHFKRDIISVPENYSIFQLFNDFIHQREHIALVIDDFGGMSGLVTMEDVVETLLGAEIVDETDKIVDLQDMAKKQWKSRYKKMTAQQNKEKGTPVPPSVSV
ncbi:CNNM domain-containing protein [Chrysiogenes arsenatis]|uniref:CNNM domain-containing protein n=1 Tax=Chrysiogenes arsenatis TaxID=309797 RepID=UPI0022A8EA57|nr:CNNM domain-containing protein [Chrysiogenes arsenatis]